ncbi:MAG: bifunctional folylpolyglutamate synthase/dihydrofolate synthase [Phycisphaera sp.]|nr:MAG: bifunctional folylpolyglutamate synthase/dihydrofolate synthase [Phycisphaera sp.]
MPTKRKSQPGKAGTKSMQGADTLSELKPSRSYAQASKMLEDLPNMEKQRPGAPVSEHLKLDRMRALMQKLGDPQNAVPCVHVAGSKGKGSMVEMLAAALGGCGYAVGIYTSPHLVDVRERIRIGTVPITESDFTSTFNSVIAAASEIESEFGSASYFEVMTAMSFLHFKEQAVDISVIEVGLGGRLDATNIVSPSLTCVTQIQLEHTHILGSTLAEVAREKAGIFKADVPAMTVPQDDEALASLREVAEQVGAPFYVLGDDIEFNQRFEADPNLGPHVRVGLMTERGEYEHIAVPLPGEHQAHNCGLALAALDRLKTLGFDTPEVRVSDGLAETPRMGRAEVVWQQPRTIVDGAHTQDSVGALVRAIGAHSRYDSMVVVFGCSADKDIDGLLEEISRGADKIIFTQASDNPRAADPEVLRARYTELTGKMAEVKEDVREAINTAARAVSKDDIILVTGSFYVAGEAKKLFLEKQAV